MKMQGNTILITGGGSGIGRGLAEAFHALGNKVIIAGRRQSVLEETTDANPGMASVTLDLTDAAAIRAFAEEVTELHPGLNVLINNAGIMRFEDLKGAPEKAPADAEAVIATNLLGPIRLMAAFLPHLQKQAHAAVINVTSGLGFVPLVVTPAYCATKAALHSYTQSLRYLMQGTPVQVIEIIPPYVQTELNGPAQKTDPRAMPLEKYIAETMALLKKSPEAGENCVQEAQGLRGAEASGKFDAVFKGFNDVMVGSVAR
ncbi:MAG TPA: SDR family oxidoreductase [Candidatus Methylacidiphilales bacterium]